MEAIIADRFECRRVPKSGDVDVRLYLTVSQKAGHRNITRAFRRKNKEWMARETTPLGQRRSGESRGPLIGGWVERNMNSRRQDFA